MSTSFSKTPNRIAESRIVSHTVGVGTPYPTSSSLPAGYFNPGATIDVVGDFTIDNYCYITDAFMRVGEGKKISIVPTDYYNTSYLSLCNVYIISSDASKLWKGIEVGSFCQIRTCYGTHIEDAEIAISSINTAFASLDISDTRFVRNKVGISIEHNNPNGWFVVPPMLSNFVNNSFSGGLSPINGTSNGKPDVGLKIKGAPYCLAWNYGNIYNTFNGLKKGVSIEGNNSIFDINHYNFQNIDDTDVEFIDGEILTVKNTWFYNPIKYGILFKNARNLIVDDNDFITFQPYAGLPTLINRYNIAVENPLPNNNIDIKNNSFDVSGNLTGSRFDCIYIGNGIGQPVTTLDYIANIQNNTLNLKNNISSSSNPTPSAVGIDLHGNNTANSSTLISNNTFDGNANNTGTGNVNSFINSLGEKFNTKIVSNHYTHGPRSRFCRLVGSSGTGNEISHNYAVQGIVPSFSGFFTDIIFMKNLKICSNTLDGNFVRGFYFIGNCLGTNFTSNTTYAKNSTYFSMLFGGGLDPTLGVLVPPIIGTQLHKGNKWFPCNNGSCHPLIQFFNDDPNVDYTFLSQFTVHTNQSLLNSNGQYSFLSEYFPANINVVSSIPNQFFRTANGQPEQGCNPPSPLVGGGNPTSSNMNITFRSSEMDTEDPINDPLIAKNGLADYYLSVAMQYDFRMQLYQKIKKNPTAYLSKNIYKEFMTKHEKENVGKNYDILKLVNEAESIDAFIVSNIKTLKEQLKSLDEEKNNFDLKNKPSKSVIEENYKKKVQLKKDLDNQYQKHNNNKKIKLKEAKKIVDNYTSRTTPESLVKEVNQIYLDVQIDQNGQATITQIERLKKIASMCPAEGGQIVYVARGFLAPKDLLDIENAIASCEPREANLMTREAALYVPKPETLKKPEFVVYPNPSKESFDINLLESESGILQMTDLTGKIVNSFKLRSGVNNIRHNLLSGMYIINVKTDKGVSSTQKLIVRN